MRGLALTFDDGPDPEWTPRLLDVLERAGARATFFPIATRAAANPELIARMLADGHTVGLHCHEHVRHSSRDRDWLEADTVAALALLRDTGVVHPKLWRTPWGDIAPFTGEVAAAHKLALVGWTVDTHDWRGDDAQTMLAATAGELGDGAIVLAHDGIGPGAQRADIEQTIAYTELVAQRARADGLTLAALS